MAAKKKQKVQTNVGKNPTSPSSVTKATSKVKSERKESKATDSKGQLAAKVKSTKAALGREQSARRKAGEGSAARTKSQIKRDDKAVKAGKKSSINQGMPKKKTEAMATKKNQAQIKKAQAARRKSVGSVRGTGGGMGMKIKGLTGKIFGFN